MSEWVKVVTSPFGLAGFALFLIFSYATREARRKSPKEWISRTFMSVAIVTLLGGLSIGYINVRKESPQTTRTAPPANQQSNQQVQQQSTGAGSPNVQGVQGNVTITEDQSKVKTEVQKAPIETPKTENK
jgi:hypothetical protein